MAKSYKSYKEELDTFLGTALGAAEARGPEAREATGGERVIGAAKALERKKRIKPMPDPEAGKTQRRKETAKRRQKRGGRLSTILSGGTDTLG